MVDRTPDCSVIVPTGNRSVELAGCLRSLRDQSLPRDRYEVIVVDSGPGDATTDVCRGLAVTMPLRVFRTPDHGRSHARNLGLGAARAPISLFLEDDDLAHPDLVWQHVDAHRQDLRDRVSVLGHSGWSPDLSVSPLMQFLTEVGPMRLTTGGREPESPFVLEPIGRGRVSCKTEFLRQKGPFDVTFTDVLEEVELGYRLTKQGLATRHRRDAVSYMSKPVTLMGACRRAELQGRALVRMAVLHPEGPVLEYCRLHENASRWQDARSRVRRLLRRARRLERDVDEEGSASLPDLFATYSELLSAMQGRGVARALGQLSQSELASLEGGRRRPDIVLVPQEVPDRQMITAHD